MTPPNKEPSYLNPREVAEICNVSIHTVIGWRRFDKGPPAIKIGGRWRYDSKLLKAWIEKNHNTTQKG